jgi:hypothetical protein
MKPTRLLAFACLCLVFCVSGFAAEPRHAATKSPPNVLVVSDVYSDLPDSLRPKPGQPVYYYLLGKKQADMGSVSRSEPRADPEKIQAEVAKALARQGFVATTVGGPMPTIAITIGFGGAVLDLANLPVPPTDPRTYDFSEPEPAQMMMNRREIELLVGADKLRKRGSTSEDKAENQDAASASRGYITVAAFDMKQLLENKKLRLLWRTRMSVDSAHHPLPESIEVMLVSGAPFFAREASAPVFVTETDRRKANVEVGNPYVVPEASKSSAVPGPIQTPQRK